MRSKGSIASAVSAIGVVVAPILANFFALFGIVAADPALLYGGFAKRVAWNSLDGFPTIDPTIGFGNQALGTYLARELAHGRIPWWNPFEGAGFPLGESIGIAVFFPFSLLYGLPNGVAIDRCVLEILAGLGTWLVLRELRVGALGAMVGGIAFALNGSFCWIGGDIGNVAPFLPFLILGIERLRRGASGGWAITALALGLSLLAGFPESAYLNGLLALAWTIVRFIQSRTRRTFGIALITSAIAGLLIGTPPLVAFVDFLGVAYAGGHLDGGLAHVIIGRAGIPQVFLPYIWGPISANYSQRDLWGGVGGYAGTGLAVLAVVSLFGSTERRLRIVLFSWIVVTLAATFGVPLVHDAVLAVPLIKFTAFFRYFPTSWEFALAILAAFAIHDLQALDVRESVRRFGLAIGAVASTIAIALLAAPVALDPDPDAITRVWLFGALEFATIVTIGLAMAATLENRTLRAFVVVAMIVFEVSQNYAIPQRAYPKSGELDLAPITYLRAHLGFSRFYTLGPIAPNYGTYYGIASINHNDLPVPTAWVDYIHEHLDRYADPVSFVGYASTSAPGKPTRAEALNDNLAGFEDACVRYVITPTDQNPFAAFSTVNIGTGPASVTELNRTRTISLQSRQSFVAAPLEAIEIFQGNDNHAADGRLNVRICDAHGTCAVGSRALADSTDNSFFHIDMRRAVRLQPPALTITLTNRTSTNRETLWTYPAAIGSRAVLRIDGIEAPKKTLRVRYQFSAERTQTKRVYHDPVLAIYELPHPQPYFDAPGCRLHASERTTIELDCARETTLRRRELLMPGWNADIDGSPVAIAPFHGAFQEVRVPAGRSRLHFRFVPPKIAYGLVALALGIIAVLLSLLIERRRARAA